MLTSLEGTITWKCTTMFLLLHIMCAPICDKAHVHTYMQSLEVKWKNCIGIKSQIAILTLTEASASGKIKDRTGRGSKIHHRRMSSYAVSRQWTAWHRWAFLPTEIWAKLYNPLHPKVQAFICWLQNCGVVQSLNMSSQCCYTDAFLIIYRKEIAEPEHSIIQCSLFLCCSLSMRQISTAICQVQLQLILFEAVLDKWDEFSISEFKQWRSSLFLQTYLYIPVV